MSDSDAIRVLEEQISQLQEELRKERQKKDSLWNGFYELFLEKIYNSDLTEESEASCKALATLVAIKMTEWANRQRESLGKKIANSGSLRMPVYTDCLNDLLFTLSQPGGSRPKTIEPLDLPEADFEDSPWEGRNFLPPSPGPRENLQSYLTENQQPMEKLNSFSKRVNVPRPRPATNNES